MPGPSLTLVFPAFEEERRLPGLFEALSSTASGDVEAAGLELVEAVIVDDGSRDDSGRMIDEAAARLPLIRPVHLPPPNSGKGAAVAAGVAVAAGDLVLMSDVDLATPLREVAKLEAALERGADLAIGSRALLTSEVQAMPRHRHLMGLVFNRLIRTVTGLPFHDTQCGFKLLHTHVARELTQEQLVAGYSFDVELLLRARRAGLRTDEVPVAWKHHPDTRVHAGIAPFRMTWDVLRVAARLRGREAAKEIRARTS